MAEETGSLPRAVVPSIHPIFASPLINQPIIAIHDGHYRKDFCEQY